ncbi:MAG: hypothetical protein K8F27_12430 [Sulfuricellaceae bacterium]|nr:hypothetical protein [Sulfuricellaceae bacterium]
MSWQISSMVIGVVAFSLLLNSVLTYFNFEKSYMALLRSRLDVVGSDINRSIEFGLTLGLHLEEMRQLQSVVDAAQRQRAGIGAVAVLDRDGVSLFDTDKRRIGKADFAAWLAPKAGAKAASGWQAVDGQDYWIAIPVKNSFNARAGTVMIGYSRALVDNKLHATQFALARNFVLVLAAFEQERGAGS